MDQDRRDAAAWAKEWYIRQKNRRLLLALAALLLIALIAFVINFVIVHAERTTYQSVEEMRKACQGRYAIESDYEDIIIDGDDIVLTYLAFTHYNRDYAERYGYDYDEEDSVYEDRVEEWDYRHGIIRTGWMGDYVVDKNGNLRRDNSYYSVFYKTDKPRPDPIDPSTLNSTEGDAGVEIPAEEEQAIEELQEDLEATQDAVEDAVLTGEDNVQT